MKPYALDFSPLVLDAGRITDEEIQKRAGHLGTAATLIAIKHIFDKTYQEYTSALEPMGATAMSKSAALSLPCEWARQL
jgi:hypothetical protein